jgi:hypothetical protein
MSGRKKPRKQSDYYRQLLKVVDEYTVETGIKMPDLMEVAAWGFRNGKLAPPPQNVIRQIARMLSRACRQDYIPDENGEPVRRRHVVKETKGDQQLTFWFKIEDATPDQMRLSAALRRNGSLADMFQLDRDVCYYNKHFNPGDPIQLDFNFNPDIAERHLPTEYDETPPADGPDGEDDGQPPAAPV